MTREAETETTPPEAAAAATPAATAPAEPTPATEARAAAEAPQTRAVAPRGARGRGAGGAGAEPGRASHAAAERARAEERHRIATIHDAARKLGVAQSVADDLVTRGTGLDAARAALIDAAAARDAAQETRPHVRTGGLDAGRDPARGGRGGALAPLRPRPLRAAASPPASGAACR